MDAGFDLFTQPTSATARTRINLIVRGLLVAAISALFVCGLLAVASAWYFGCATFWVGAPRLVSPNRNCRPFHQALTAMNNGEFEAAVMHFTLAIQEAPDNHDAFALRGQSHYVLGQLEEALSDYSMAIQLDSDDVTSISSRAYILGRLGRDLDSALAEIDHVLDVSPGRGDYLDTRAYVYFRMGNYEAALDDANAALQRDELFAYYTLGLIYEAQGQSQEAIDNYSAFLIAFPDYSDSAQAQDARERIEALGGKVP